MKNETLFETSLLEGIGRAAPDVGQGNPAGWISTRPEDLAEVLEAYDFLVNEVARLHKQVNQKTLLADYFAPNP
jgi:hypothetical protein